jgi:hypothetical protein
MTPEHYELISRIRASARAVEQAVAMTPSDKMNHAPDPGEWTIRQVLLHTRDVAMMAYGLRIRRCLIEDNPQFASYEEEAYRQVNPSGTDTPETIVQSLLGEHDIAANLLSSLPDEAWQRSGRNADGNVRNIEFFANRLVAHAEEHAKPISDFRF